jgi:succinate dehydrogenase / fumarate reductase iron-sulfur subunit
MANMPVIRDLVVDMDAVHWKKIGRVQPWLTPAEPVPEREYLVAHERMVDLTQTQACIQCGACVSACLSLEVDPGFIGPAALAKAFRFVADPREAGAQARLLDLTSDPHGLYDCTHCFACIEACPKGVEPMNQIMRLRRTANADFGIVDPNNGHRHEQGFVDNVRANGLLNEGDLMAASYGGKLSPAWWREAVSNVPVVLTAVRRGKVTLEGVRHGHRKRFRGLGRLFDAVLSQPRRHELNLYVSGTDDDPSPPAGASTGMAADAAAGASGPNPRRAL